MQWLNDLINKYTSPSPSEGASTEEAAPAPQQKQAGDDFSKYINPQAVANSFKPYGEAVKKAVHDFEAVFERVIQVESRGKHTTADGKLTTSPVGAKGITQIMPATGKKPGYGIAPLKDESEAEYLRVGKSLLKAYTEEFGGDIEKGLAAYNWGIGNMKRAVSKHGAEWKNALPSETANYLKKTLSRSDSGNQTARKDK